MCPSHWTVFSGMCSKAGVLITVSSKHPFHCSLLWIPDVCDVMADREEEGGGKGEERFVRSFFTVRQVQTERQSENSSRGKQGNLFQKTLQGVSAKSHTILSAANIELQCRTKYLSMSRCILRQTKSTDATQSYFFHYNFRYLSGKTSFFRNTKTIYLQQQYLCRVHKV